MKNAAQRPRSGCIDRPRTLFDFRLAAQRLLELGQFLLLQLLSNLRLDF
jgi:hypothetical protein